MASFSTRSDLAHLSEEANYIRTRVQAAGGVCVFRRPSAGLESRFVPEIEPVSGDVCGKGGRI